MKRHAASPLGVVVLYNDSQNMIKGESHDMLAEKSVIQCAESIADALQDYYQVAKAPIYTDVEIALAPYPPTDWVVFNLGEGVDGRLFEWARIAWALEAMGYCFTGAGGDALALTSHKQRTKIRLQQAHISSPLGWLFRTSSEIGNDINFPVIVKPLVEDGSLGIEHNAVVFDLTELRKRVDYIYHTYRQQALVEEFISGREINISIWNNPPELLPFCEIDFSDYQDPYQQIVSFAAKWEVGSYDYHHTPGICPANLDPQLTDKISKIALETWRVMDCKDYARIDMRVDVHGNPFVIEVNCNPDLSADAGFFRSVQAAGYTFQQMALKILNSAMGSYLTLSSSSRV